MWQTPRMFGTSCVKCGSLLNGACEAEGYPGIQRKKNSAFAKKHNETNANEFLNKTSYFI